MSQAIKSKFNIDESICWQWGGHWAYGQIREIYTDRVSRTIKGKEITRNGSPEKPAYLIVQENGQEVLKLETELHPISDAP